MPRVSIGLPVFNGENFIRSAIDSILRQTFNNFELIISDNASTDGTHEICRSYAEKDSRIKLYRNEKNIGGARNYNRAFELSSGEYFKWAAHDDVISSTYLEKTVEILDKDLSIAGCFSATCFIDEHENILRRQHENLSIYGINASDRIRKLIDFQIKSDDIFWANFGLIRRDILKEKSSLYQFFVASDQTLLFQLILAGNFYQIPDYLFFRRDHPNVYSRALRTPHERMYWFDTEKKQKIILPNWTLFLKHVTIILNSKLSFKETVLCLIQILRRFGKKWRTLGGEIKFIPRQLFKS